MSGGGAYVSGSDYGYFMAHEVPFSSREQERLTTEDTKVHEGESNLSVCCHCYAHVVDHARGKFAGFHFGGAFHEALEIIGYFFLFDGALQALLDQIGSFGPSEMAEHHDAGQNDGAGIDDVFVGILGSGAVGG